MTRIKICGLSREEDIANVNEAGPDYCGFIIQVPRSRRNVSPERAAELSIRLDGRITPVGVFVNAPAELPARLAREGIIRMIQLHGQEDEDYIQRLRCLRCTGDSGFFCRLTGRCAPGERQQCRLCAVRSGSRGDREDF